MVGFSFPFRTRTLMPSVRGHSANWGGVGGSEGATEEWKEAIRKQHEGRVSDIIGQSLRVREAICAEGLDCCFFPAVVVVAVITFRLLILITQHVKSICKSEYDACEHKDTVKQSETGFVFLGFNFAPVIGFQVKRCIT